MWTVSHKAIRSFKSEKKLFCLAIPLSFNESTKRFAAHKIELRWNKFNAPINGLPQDGRVGEPRGIRLRKAHVGGDFDIHNGCHLEKLRGSRKSINRTRYLTVMSVGV